MVKILMVCLGNICRSPMAHGIMESKLPPDQFYVDSAGTANYHIGDMPDRRAITTARNHGIDISHQRGQQFNRSFFDKFDHIYVMDRYNYEDVMSMTRTHGDAVKVKLILDEDDASSIKQVPDPYYGDESDFEYVFNLFANLAVRVNYSVDKTSKITVSFCP